MFNNIKHNNLDINIIILISFIIFGMLNVILPIGLHKALFAGDNWFHWQRILELLRSNTIFVI